MIVHLGIDLCCANDLGVCSGRQRQTFNNWTHHVCHDSSESVFNTDYNGMRHFSKTMVCANAGYLLSHPSTGVRRADYFYSSTEKSSAQRFEIKTKNMGTTPHKALGVGSLPTIHRASKCLPQVVWYLQCTQKTNMNAWIRKKPKDCYSKWWTYNTVTTTKIYAGHCERR